MRSDPERMLTERGERQARAAGAALERIGARFDAILVSPKARAAQTAQLAAETAPVALQGELQVHRPLSSGYDVAQALDDLAGVGADGHLLVVGHEPDFARVIGDLTGAVIDLKKCGLAVVRLQGVAGELMLLLRPRELALIAGDVTAEV